MAFNFQQIIQKLEDYHSDMINWRNKIYDFVNTNADIVFSFIGVADVTVPSIPKMLTDLSIAKTFEASGNINPYRAVRVFNDGTDKAVELKQSAFGTPYQFDSTALNNGVGCVGYSSVEDAFVEVHEDAGGTKYSVLRSTGVGLNMAIAGSIQSFPETVDFIRVAYNDVMDAFVFVYLKAGDTGLYMRTASLSGNTLTINSETTIVESTSIAGFYNILNKSGEKEVAILYQATDATPDTTINFVTVTFNTAYNDYTVSAVVVLKSFLGTSPTGFYSSSITVDINGKYIFKWIWGNAGSFYEYISYYDGANYTSQQVYDFSTVLTFIMDVSYDFNAQLIETIYASGGIVIKAYGYIDATAGYQEINRRNIGICDSSSNLKFSAINDINNNKMFISFRVNAAPAKFVELTKKGDIIDLNLYGETSKCTFIVKDASNRILWITRTKATLIQIDERSEFFGYSQNVDVVSDGDDILVYGPRSYSTISTMGALEIGKKYYLAKDLGISTVENEYLIGVALDTDKIMRY